MCVYIYIVLHNINGILRFNMFQLFVCIKSLKSFKIVELHPQEGTPSQEVNVIFLLGLMSLFLPLRGRCRTWSDENVSTWNSVIFPRLRAVDSEVLLGVVCSLCVQMCWCTALSPTAVCNLPPSQSGLLIQSAFTLNSHLLGFLTNNTAWIPGFLVQLHSRESIPPSQTWGVGLQFCTGHSGKSPHLKVLPAAIRDGRRRILNLWSCSTLEQTLLTVHTLSQVVVNNVLASSLFCDPWGKVTQFCYCV